MKKLLTSFRRNLSVAFDYKDLDKIYSKYKERKGLCKIFRDSTRNHISEIYKLLGSRSNCSCQTSFPMLESFLEEMYSENWKAIDVPGDGNCWIYAVCLSLVIRRQCTFPIDPTNCRVLMSDLFYSISNSSQEIEMLLKCSCVNQGSFELYNSILLKHWAKNRNLGMSSTF